MAKNYTGPVFYRDGWHWSDEDEPRKLFLQDDGTYRPATDADESWHDRHHKQFVTAELT